MGQSANVVAENNQRVTYYRPGNPGVAPFEYGRIGDFTGPDECAPLVWELDAYSGQPFNMHIFYQGYAQEVLYYCSCLLEDRPVRIAGLEDAWHVTRFFAALQNAESSPLDLAEPPAWTLVDDHRIPFPPQMSQ